MYSPALLVDEQPLVDPALLAAAGFLAGYSGATRDGYTIGLRKWWEFCETPGLAVLDVQRAHLDLYVRSLEQHGYAPGTIACRLSTVSSYYKWCYVEEVIDRNPATHVRRPKVSLESTTLGLDREELGRFLTAAELAGDRAHALACLLGLNGLRVSEACNTSIENIGLERSHHTLLIDRKGGKRAVIPLAPRTHQAILLVVEGRDTGPILSGEDGGRLGRYAAYRIVRRIAKQAGLQHQVSPHSLRHAFCTAALDAGVPLRDVQEAMSHSDPRSTQRYDRNRQSLDRHAAYFVATFIAGTGD
jgi:integrase/recombinase XerD